MLTKKQLELLLFIDGHLKEQGTAPSFEEMKKAVNLKSKSGIHRLVMALEERGFLRRLPHRARALEVMKLPSSHSEQVTPPAAIGFPPRVIKVDFNNSREQHSSTLTSHHDNGSSDSVALPLYGRIAAGMPIEALRDETNFIDVPGNMIAKDDCYALQIDGDSMIEAGIHDGDTVIIERCDSAENGTIVVALVDDAEVTLKRLRRKGQSIALEPANKEYETRIFGPGRVRVQGRLAGLMRNYQ